MRLSGFVAQRRNVQNVAEAFYQPRFASAAAADQNVQVAVEMKPDVIKEAAFPGDGEEFGVRLWRGIAVQADSGAWIEEGLAQALDVCRPWRPW